MKRQMRFFFFLNYRGIIKNKKFTSTDGQKYLKDYSMMLTL